MFADNGFECYVCAVCGSNRVTFQTYVMWDSRDQVFKVGDADLDSGFCEACEESGTAEWQVFDQWYLFKEDDK